MAEFLVLLGTFREHPLWAVVAGTGMILGAAYFLYMYKRVMFEEETVPEVRIRKWKQLRDLEFHHLLPFVLILFAALLMGLYPAPFVKIMNHTAKFVLGG